TLPAADRPSRLETADLFVGPGVESVLVVLALEQLDAGRRIDLDQIAAFRVRGPFKKPTHRLKEIVRGMWCGCSALAARLDRVACDLAQLLIARGLDDRLVDVFALAPRRIRKRGPCRAVAVTLQSPCEGPRLGSFRWRRLAFEGGAVFGP